MLPDKMHAIFDSTATSFKVGLFVRNGPPTQYNDVVNQHVEVVNERAKHSFENRPEWQLRSIATIFQTCL
jgi:hypothetical protein